MEKNNFYIDIVPVLVKEVFEEVRNTFQSDVTTHHNVPVKSNTPTIRRRNTSFSDGAPSL